MLRKDFQHLDVVGNVRSVVLGGDDKITEEMAIDDFLSFRVGKFGGRSNEC